MKRKLRSCMALILAASTAMSSVGSTGLTVFAAEESTTEVSTESMSEINLSQSEKIVETPSTEKPEEMKETEVKTEETQPATDETQGSSEETEETTGSTESTEATEATEATETTEETKSTESETGTTEETKSTESEAGETTDVTEASETDEEVKESEDVKTPDETVVTKTSELELTVNPGGKILVKDKDNNVIKEVISLPRDTKPFTIDEEVGTVVTLEFVADSDAYNVATYRLMTDKGKVLEDKQYGRGLTTVKETYTFGEEKRVVSVSFTGAEEEDEEEKLGIVRLSLGEGGQKLVVSCDGTEVEVLPEMLEEEPLEAYFPVGKDIAIEAVAEEGYEVEFVELSTGEKSEDGKITFQLKEEGEEVSVSSNFKKAEESKGKVIKSNGPGVTYIYKGSEDGPKVAELKSGEEWVVEDTDSLNYTVEMYPDDLSLPYSITTYKNDQKVDTFDSLWIGLNPGEGERSYFKDISFEESEDSEKVVCEFKSIEAMSGIPTASGNNHEYKGDFANLDARASATTRSIFEAKKGDVYWCYGTVTSHMYAHNYFVSQVPMRVRLTPKQSGKTSKDYNDIWGAFGALIFNFYQCASTTSECCPFYGTPGKVYFICTRVDGNTRTFKTFFENNYRHTLKNGYYWQNAEGSASFDNNSFILKKAVYVRSAAKLDTLVKYDRKDVYNKKAKFEIYKSDKTTLVKTVTTSEQGLATIELPKGTYYIKEIVAAGGCEKANGFWQIKVNALGMPTSVSYQGTTNMHIGYNQVQTDGGNKAARLVNHAYIARVGVQKTNENGVWVDGLNGAVFGIWDDKNCAKGKEIKQVTITHSGVNEFDIDLPLGNTFWVKEISAPDGYEPDTSIKRVVTSVSAASGKNAYTETVNFVVKVANTTKKKINLQVSKTFKPGTGADAWKNLTTYALTGAEYEFYSDAACKKPIASVAVKKNGKSNVVQVAMTKDIGSKLWVKEVEAPESGTYQLDGTIYEVPVVKVSDDLYEAKFAATDAAKYTDLTGIIKKSFTRATSLSLAGAVFSIGYKQTAQGPDAGSYTYTWQFKTDANGNLMLNAAGYVSGPMNAILVSNGKYYFPLGSYDVSEVTPPVGAIKSDTVYHFVAMDPKGNTQLVPFKIIDAEYNFIDGSTQDVPNTPDTGWAKVKKTSTRTDITDGNNMYSLAGAVFTLTHSDGVTKYTLTTDANGDTPTIEVKSGRYTVEETTVPKGYKKAANTVVTVVRDQTATVNVADEPVVGTTDVAIKKYANGNTSKSLAGAQFKVEYFDNIDCSGTPKKTWVFETKQTQGSVFGQAAFIGDYKVSGDSLYGDNIVPLGSIRVTEVKAPVGFDLDDDPVKTGTITQNGNSAIADFDGQYNAVIESYDGAYFGGVKINKDCIDRGSNPSGDGTLAGAVFAIYNNNDYTVYRPDNKDVAIAKGEEICRITTDVNGDAVTQRLMNVDTFGLCYPLMSDSNYVIKEINPSTGYKIPEGYEKEFYVPLPENGNEVLVDLTGEPVIEPVIRGGIQITKEDSELKRESDPQGAATLEGAEFTVKNVSTNPVVVNGKEYAVGDIVMTLTTDASGYATTGEKALPYGTYEIRETKASEGYLLTNYVDTIQIREDGQYSWAKSYATTLGEKDYWYEDIIHFNIDVFKFKNTLTSEDPTDRVDILKGIEFSIKNVNDHSVLVNGKEYAPGEIVMTIITDEYGFATTKGDGNCTSNGALPYGKYLIHEVNCPEELVPIKDFTVDGTNAGGVYDGKTYKGIYLNDVPIESRIRIRKVDAETGKIIPQGAKFQILDENKEVMRFRVTYPTTYYISEFTTNEEGIVETPTKLPYGTYYLHEIDPPYDRDGLSNGYVLGGEDLQFKVDKNNSWEEVIEVTYSNAPTKGKVQVTKVDADTNNAVVGAVYAVFADKDIVTGDGTVRYTKGTQVDVFTIGADGKGTTGDLYLGEYHLQEIKAPRGYCLDTNVYPFTLKYDDSKKDVEVLLTVREEALKNKPTVMKLYKDDIDDLALDGVKFKLERIGDIEDSGIANDLAVDGGEFVTANGGNLEVKYLVSGIYSLTEIETLPGYVLDSTPRYVTVDSNGFIFKSDAEGNNLDESGAKSDTVKLEWENDYTKWDFSKVDVTGDGELPGAELEIYNSDGEKVYSWTSTEEMHRIVKIPLGEYTLVEKTAPAGYVIAKEVPFEVINTGVVQKATMIDKIVTAHKLDQDEKNVSGAKIEVYEVTENTEEGIVYGDLVDSWTTDGNNHDINNLVEGKTYVMVEKEAPAGYVKAKPVVFEVTYEKENQDVYMVDKKVTVHKLDQNGDPMEGATLTVYEVVAPNDDPEADAQREKVDEWVTDGTAHDISGLEVDHYYELCETKAAEDWVTALPIAFYVADDGKDQEVSMTDIRVKAHKYDETAETYVVGATLEVRDLDNNVVDTWVTDEEFHYISGLVAGHSYSLIEVEAPKGFAKALPVKFTVDDNGKDQEVVMINKKVIVSKVDTEVKELAGAELHVEDENGKVVDSWVSDGTPHEINGLEVGKTYTLVEDKAPEGYAIASPIVFTVEDNAKNDEFNLINKQVFVHKVDVTGEKELPGAKIKVLDLEGNVVDEWTSEEEAHPISNIRVNETYILHEEVAPDGYVIASDIEFTVYDDFKVQYVHMIDKQVLMSKYDVTGEKETPGATLVVYDSEGKEMDRWVSGEEAHPIKNLEVTKTYTLHEEVAADGYVVASDIQFTVADDGQNQKVEMIDKQVFMSKVDVTGEKEIPGAKITVYDKDGKEVDSWVSEETPHAIKNLKVTETYILHEEVAPDGYVIATDIEFTVVDDFKNQTEKMIDKQLFVTKQSVTGEDELPGAKLTVTKKGTNEVVDEWVSGDTPHAVNGLKVGESYTLTEVQAPDGYVIASTIDFDVLDDFQIQTVTMKDKQVFMSKVDVSGEEVPGATITVTDEDGNVVDEWVSGEEPHPIKGLEVGKTYTLTETQAPDGYVIAESIQFTVEDDFQVQHVEMVDKQVFVSKTDITTGEEIEGAHLKVVDEEGNVVDEWVSVKDEKHPISGLEVGKTYKLIEELAPDGYVTAEEIEFTVLDDFQIQYVEMKDDYTKVEISKQDITTGKELPGAKLVIRDEDGNVVEEWTSTNEPHYIEYLPVGKYTLHEDAAPAGYKVASDIEFEVKDTGEVQKVVMKDELQPKKSIPQTGENLWVFVGAALVVLLAIIVLIVLRKKKRSKGNK